MKRFLHNCSHEVLTTFNQGEFVPVMLFDAIPNETIRLGSELLVRTQPLLAPMYAKCRAVISYYAVPNRLLQTDWDDFRTGGPNGDSTTEAPYVMSPAGTGFAVGSLADYLGVPTGVPNLKVSAFPFRAYNLIWNCYIRDKDLQPERAIGLGNGLDTTTDLSLANICWEKNNLTTARPTPQQGAAVSIPVVGSADVMGLGSISGTASQGAQNIRQSDGTVQAYNPTLGGSAGDIRIALKGTSPNLFPNVTAELDGVSIPVEEMRLSNSIQRFKEAMMRFVGGGTLPEFYRLFGVAPQDMRMQWPERLGGGESTIQFSEVLQTAEGTDPVGELRGHGIGVAKGRRVIYKTMEDCIIIGLVSVKPKTVYMQALAKTWSRFSRWDYFLPQLQNLGQQPVLNQEVDASHAQPEGVFGYQDHNYAYRRIESRVSGEFRTTLNFWHMGIEYDTPPALNGDFVEAVPTDRVYAAGGAAHQLQVRVWNKIKRKSLVLPMGQPLLK